MKEPDLHLTLAEGKIEKSCSRQIDGDTWPEEILVFILHLHGWMTPEYLLSRKANFHLLPLLLVAS